jgi:hypothetical protein
MRNWTLATVLAVVTVLSGFLPTADAGLFGRRRHQECAAPAPACCTEAAPAPVVTSAMPVAAPVTPAVCCTTEAPAVTAVTTEPTYRTRRFARARRFREPVAFTAPAAYATPVAYVAPTSASACCTP